MAIPDLCLLSLGESIAESFAQPLARFILLPTHHDYDGCAQSELFVSTSKTMRPSFEDFVPRYPITLIQSCIGRPTFASLKLLQVNMSLQLEGVSFVPGHVLQQLNNLPPTPPYIILPSYYYLNKCRLTC